MLQTAEAFGEDCVNGLGDAGKNHGGSETRSRRAWDEVAGLKLVGGGSIVGSFVENGFVRRAGGVGSGFLSWKMGLVGFVW
jgi:hypothetical protein